MKESDFWKIVVSCDIAAITAIAKSAGESGSRYHWPDGMKKAYREFAKEMDLHLSLVEKEVLPKITEDKR